MMTTIHVVGTIATDPKLIHTASGTKLCSFRLASNERRYDREKHDWVDGNTNWFGVVSFRGMASHAHESFRRGDRVIVSGRLRMHQWEKDDRRGTSIEIDADAIGHDVRWGVSRFEKRVGSKSDVDSASGQQDHPQANPATMSVATGSDTATADTAPESTLLAGTAPESITPENAVGWRSAA